MAKSTVSSSSHVVDAIPSGSRVKTKQIQSLRPSKRLKQPMRLPSAWRISGRAYHLIWRYRRLFTAITIVYGLLNLLLVQGLANHNDITTIKQELSQVFNGQFSSLASGLAGFVLLVGSAGNGSSNTAGAYQFFLLLLTSLALIWALRQTSAGTLVRMRDAYYRSMYPLVPFMLVLLVIGLELLPMLIGTSLYSIIISNGIAITGIEKLAWAGLAILLSLVSVYLISSSIFALYIVTLPDMTPLKALRSARQLVKLRRWVVARKLLFLPVLLLAAAAIIMVPIIIWLTALSQWVFFILTMLALVAVHAYLYCLYRELLNE